MTQYLCLIIVQSGISDISEHQHKGMVSGGVGVEDEIDSSIIIR